MASCSFVHLRGEALRRMASCSFVHLRGETLRRKASRPLAALRGQNLQSLFVETLSRKASRIFMHLRGEASIRKALMHFVVENSAARHPCTWWKKHRRKDFAAPQGKNKGHSPLHINENFVNLLP